jgi:hypothetical protein
VDAKTFVTVRRRRRRTRRWRFVAHRLHVAPGKKSAKFSNLKTIQEVKKATDDES